MVFEKGRPPTPCRYKIFDERGNEETVSIHRITWVDQRATQFVVYHCKSYYENITKRYELVYWIERFNWELFM